MIISRVNAGVLYHAAADIGVTVDVRPLNIAGTRFRVKVFPDTLETVKGADAKYQRENPLTGRKVRAVCWHGFRDFFHAVFAQTPNAVFHTAMDTWKGAADFEARYRDSGVRNVGSPANPVCACEACRCPERGSAN